VQERELEPTDRKTPSRRHSGVLALAVALIAVAGFALAGLPTTSAASTAPSLPLATVSAPPLNTVTSSHVVDQKPSDASYARMGPDLSAASASGSTALTVATPGCSTGPCPMGITDYGIHNTSSGTLATSSYNATYLESFFDTGASFGVGASVGGGCLDPDAETDVCVTVQENAIVKGLEVKNHAGEYWAQDVAEIAYDSSCSSPCVSNTYSVTWLDNVWNFSYSKICPSGRNAGAGCINPSNIKGNLSSVCAYYGGYPSFYYCVGPTVYDLSPPFSVNTAMTVNSYGPCVHTSTKTCVNFYGEIEEGGTYVFGGYFDGVSFASGKSVGTPYFHVQNLKTPLGLPYDYEWVLGGPGGGSTNVVLTYGDMQSFYCLSTCSTSSNVHSIAHAWSSGRDTGESISDVYMIPNLNFRDLALIDFAADNPQTELW
jgi:Thermopsin